MVRAFLKFDNIKQEGADPKKLDTLSMKSYKSSAVKTLGRIIAIISASGNKVLGIDLDEFISNASKL